MTEAEWLALKQAPLINRWGVRRSLVLSQMIKDAVNAYRPEPQWALQHVGSSVFHLWWPNLSVEPDPSRALCNVRAVRKPSVPIDFPLLCGNCAWFFMTATGTLLVE